MYALSPLYLALVLAAPAAWTSASISLLATHRFHLAVQDLDGPPQTTDAPTSSSADPSASPASSATSDVATKTDEDAFGARAIKRSIGAQALVMGLWIVFAIYEGTQERLESLGLAAPVALGLGLSHAAANRLSGYFGMRRLTVGRSGEKTVRVEDRPRIESAPLRLAIVLLVPLLLACINVPAILNVTASGSLASSPVSAAAVIVLAFLCVGQEARGNLFLVRGKPLRTFRSVFLQILAADAAVVVWFGLWAAMPFLLPSSNKEPKTSEPESDASLQAARRLMTLMAFVQPLQWVGLFGRLIAFIHRVDSKASSSSSPSFLSLPPVTSVDDPERKLLTGPRLVLPSAAAIHRHFLHSFTLRSFLSVTSAKIASFILLSLLISIPLGVQYLGAIIFDEDCPEVYVPLLDYCCGMLALVLAAPFMLLCPLALAFARGGLDEARVVWEYKEEYYQGRGSVGGVNKKAMAEQESAQGQGGKEVDHLLV